MIKSIIYKITYLPHLYNKTPPFYYLGSSFRYKSNYLGADKVAKDCLINMESNSPALSENKLKCLESSMLAMKPS